MVNHLPVHVINNNIELLKRIQEAKRRLQVANMYREQIKRADTKKMIKEENQNWRCKRCGIL